MRLHAAILFALALGAGCTDDGSSSGSTLETPAPPPEPTVQGGNLWFFNSPTQAAVCAGRMSPEDGVEALRGALPSIASLPQEPKFAVVGYADLESATFYDSARASNATYCYFNLENAHPALQDTSPATPERVAKAIEVAIFAAAAIRSFGFKVAFDSGVQFRSSTATTAYTAEAEFARMADAICIQGYEYANNAPDRNGDGIPDANPQGAIDNYVANRSRLLAANPDLDFIFPAVGGSTAVIDGTAVTPDGQPRPARPISQIVEHYNALYPVAKANGDYVQIFFQSDTHYAEFLTAIGR